jgi:protein TonB
MSYAVQQTYSRKQIFWLGFVVVLHILLAYALVNGLARKVVNIIKEPLTVSIIEEVKVQPPAPPPPKPRATPPRVNAPPPPFVPPAEVPVQAMQSPIATSQAPTPPAPPAPPAPTVAAAPAVVNVSVVCPNSNEISRDVPFPPQADRLGLSGDVLVEFVVTPTGAVKDVVIKRSSNKLFNATAIAAVGKLRCTGKAQDVTAVMPFVFQRN